MLSDGNVTNREKGSTPPAAPNFIRNIIEEDIRAGKNGGKVVTRFPPEPNGYLHIGHAKAISIDFGLASEFGGRCHLRFDDTNPSKEETGYIEAIKHDIRWLGWDWGEHLYFASDYFKQMYEWAVHLIKSGKAYVDSLSPEEISEYRGTSIKPGEKVETRPGKESPFRNRTVEENLDLFERMQKGEFREGAHVLRAKIDMAHPNLNMRDPIMYRIMNAPHFKQGDSWRVYPMYDWAHGLEDSIEGVTHSLCSLEFENHRPLYDWFLDQLPVPCHPRQIEFARLNLTYTIMSKRKLLQIVRGGHVKGWDDPRMPTICGLRRRGYTPASIRLFCERIGVAKRDSMVDIALLEYCIREELNKTAPRAMAVLRPLRVVIENYPDDRVEQLEAVNNPEDAAAGTRQLLFSRELYIERDDFMEDPPKKFYRLAPGREVRLRYAYFITCTGVVKDSDSGEIKELRCTYDPATRGGDAPDGRKVKSTLHWVSARHALPTEVRLYDRMFTKENPGQDGGSFVADINPNSLEIIHDCMREPALANVKPGDRYQFERLGYFCVDPDTAPASTVFNRTVSLKDEWARMRQT